MGILETFFFILENRVRSFSDIPSGFLQRLRRNHFKMGLVIKNSLQTGSRLNVLLEVNVTQEKLREKSTLIKQIDQPSVLMNVATNLNKRILSISVLLDQCDCSGLIIFYFVYSNVEWLQNLRLQQLSDQQFRKLVNSIWLLTKKCLAFDMAGAGPHTVQGEACALFSGSHPLQMRAQRPSLG